MLQVRVLFGEKVSVRINPETLLALSGDYPVIRPAPETTTGQPRTSRA